MWNNEEMNQLVRIDPDLPAIKRWMQMAIFMPEMADSLGRIYGSKDERKMLKKAMRQTNEAVKRVEETASEN